jgi:hypothetical protein
MALALFHGLAHFRIERRKQGVDGVQRQSHPDWTNPVIRQQ